MLKKIYSFKKIEKKIITMINAINMYSTREDSLLKHSLLPAFRNGQSHSHGEV